MPKVTGNANSFPMAGNNNALASLRIAASNEQMLDKPICRGPQFATTSPVITNNQSPVKQISKPTWPPPANTVFCLKKP